MVASAIGCDIAYASPGLDDGLVGHWALNEGGSSTTATDDVSGNDGTWQGDGPYYTQPGPLDSANAGRFSWENLQYVDIPDSPSYTFGSSFGMSFWIKGDEWIPWNIILGKDSWDAREGWSVFIGDAVGDMGVLCYSIAGAVGEGDSLCTADVVPAHTWVRITISYDDGLMSIYMDDDLVAQGEVAFANSTQDLFIGARHDNDGTGSTDYFKGAIADVRLYNRVLTADDVAALVVTVPSDVSSSSDTPSEDAYARQGAGGRRGHRTNVQHATAPVHHAATASRKSPKAAAGTYHVAATSVLVRQSGGLRFVKGDAVEVIALLRGGRLAKIRLPNGKTGFVLAKMLAK